MKLLPLLVAALLGGCASGGVSSAPQSSLPKPRPKPQRQRAAPPATPAVPEGLVLHGPRTRRRVALTFDADMTVGMREQLRSGRVRGWYDRALFQELKKTHTPATIFLTGLWTAQYPSEVRALAKDPLIELDNHSFDHAGFLTPCYGLPTLSTERQKHTEIVAARRIIRRIARVSPRYFRFPGGCHTAADVRLVRAYGERPVQWDVVSGDAFEPDAGVIVHSVLSQVRPGSIVIAHCIGAPNTPATAAAFARIIPALRARGYRLVTLGELLSAGRGKSG